MIERGADGGTPMIIVLFWDHTEVMRSSPHGVVLRTREPSPAWMTSTYNRSGAVTENYR